MAHPILLSQLSASYPLSLQTEAGQVVEHGLLGSHGLAEKRVDFWVCFPFAYRNGEINVRHGSRAGFRGCDFTRVGSGSGSRWHLTQFIVLWAS